jgi:hypothetical protein
VLFRDRLDAGRRIRGPDGLSETDRPSLRDPR